MIFCALVRKGSPSTGGGFAYLEARGPSIRPHRVLRLQEEKTMAVREIVLKSAAAICIGALSMVAPPSLNAQQTASVAIDNDDIGGVVTGPRGPEAGVWVIAETRDLPVRFIKIVVTDDRGRYVVPDLPKANYDVWVRGYGLVDSPKV